MRVGKNILVTAFLSLRKMAKEAFENLYWQRWNVEWDLRNIKTTLGMDILCFKAPQMGDSEFRADPPEL